MKPNKLVFKKFKGKVFAVIEDEKGNELAVAIVEPRDILKEMNLFVAFPGFSGRTISSKS